jgi:hypothetical protein
LTAKSKAYYLRMMFSQKSWHPIIGMYKFNGNRTEEVDECFRELHNMGFI